MAVNLINSDDITISQDNTDIQLNLTKQIPTIDSTISTSSTNGVENQAITNYVNNLFECSTTEKEVGKWIDGSTIYEKSTEASITGRNITIFTITNLKAVLYCQTYLKRTGNYHNINNWGKEATDYGLMYVNNNNVIFDSSFTGDLYATIRYIKTS